MGEDNGVVTKKIKSKAAAYGEKADELVRKQLNIDIIKLIRKCEERNLFDPMKPPKKRKGELSAKMKRELEDDARRKKKKKRVSFFLKADEPLIKVKHKKDE